MGNLAPLPEAHRVELGDEPDFDLGEMSVCPAERIVVVGGERREVQPRVMQVLVALAKARPAVVSRDRLGEMCWDGRIVGDDALNRCVLALRHLVADIAPPPFAIETVSRVGYRLIERGAERDATSRLGSPKLWRQVALLAVLFIALAAAFYAWRQRSLAAQPASIAVLPFRNLGNGDPYFAEGIGEEILGQLAGEPQFRIVGGSSRGQTGESADVRDLGRRLDVDYVLEGTVRRQNQQVRVNAHLLRVSDGTRLWSHGYDGDLDDIFAIQRRIGVAIAGALQRKLSQAPVLAGPLVTDGQAYGLYLTARGLIRSRSRRAGPTAVDLLRDAIQIDQGYAPAWASLGEATLLAGALNDSESFVASASEAQGHVRHALRLAPDLPEAHRALGGLAGFGTPEAIAHLRRAAELEPNNAEYMIGLGIAYGATGEFEKELASYRKAAELDPFWFRAASSVATTVAEMGDRAKAEAIALESVPPNGVEQQLVLGKIAAISGDFSEAIRRWSIVIEADSPRWSNSARINRDGLAFALGLRAEPPMTPPRPLDQRHLWRVSMNDGPKPSVWQARNRNRLAAIVYRDENHVAAK